MGVILLLIVVCVGSSLTVLNSGLRCDVWTSIVGPHWLALLNSSYRLTLVVVDSCWLLLGWLSWLCSNVVRGRLVSIRSCNRLATI
jgi:hypothetical protein